MTGDILFWAAVTLGLSFLSLFMVAILFRRGVRLRNLEDLGDLLFLMVLVLMALPAAFIVDALTGFRRP